MNFGMKSKTLNYFQSMSKTKQNQEEGPSVGPVGEKGVEGPPGIDNSFGPKNYQRDEHGLLKNVQYVFNEDGSVNWRAMIKEEHHKAGTFVIKVRTPKKSSGFDMESHKKKQDMQEKQEKKNNKSDRQSKQKTNKSKRKARIAKGKARTAK